MMNKIIAISKKARKKLWLARYPALAPTVPDTVVPTPVVSSPMVTVNNGEEPVLQEPIQTDATDEGEQ
jgi:hypothetical protein